MLVVYSVSTYRRASAPSAGISYIKIFLFVEIDLTRKVSVELLIKCIRTHQLPPPRRRPLLLFPIDIFNRLIVTRLVEMLETGENR